MQIQFFGMKIAHAYNSVPCFLHEATQAVISSMLDYVPGGLVTIFFHRLFIEYITRPVKAIFNDLMIFHIESSSHAHFFNYNMR